MAAGSITMVVSGISDNVNVKSSFSKFILCIKSLIKDAIVFADKFDS